jgi:hypothetical protein
VSSKTGEATGVYVLTTEGEVACLSARNGKVSWTQDLANRFNGKLLLLSSPRVQDLPSDKGPGRRLYLGVVTVGASGRSPMVVCLEDQRGSAPE